jgi:hypothetical protein
MKGIKPDNVNLSKRLATRVLEHALACRTDRGAVNWNQLGNKLVTDADLMAAFGLTTTLLSKVTSGWFVDRSSGVRSAAQGPTSTHPSRQPAPGTGTDSKSDPGNAQPVVAVNTQVSTQTTALRKKRKSAKKRLGKTASEASEPWSVLKHYPQGGIKRKDQLENLSNYLFALCWNATQRFILQMSRRQANGLGQYCPQIGLVIPMVMPNSFAAVWKANRLDYEAPQPQSSNYVFLRLETISGLSYLDLSPDDRADVCKWLEDEVQFKVWEDLLDLNPSLDWLKAYVGLLAPPKA